ncbi:hypothetical protein [Mycolicibacterium vaccae]|uniref:hypothetical protein n=1 Tax=Mycolicibacterium vaccae TaxID=1810 RepID=UPI003CFF0D75
MSIIRIELANGFMFGDDVVLLAMDGDGVADFASALRSALQRGSSELEHSGLRHEFSIEAGQSAVELGAHRVVWRLDQAKASEVLDVLNVLGEHGRPGHQYVDISQPTDTLVLSRDEYIKPS